MARDNRPPSAGLAGGVIVLVLTVAGLVLSKYSFDGPGLGTTWPALPIAVGLMFAFGGLLEMGLGIAGVFGLVLVHNLNYLRFGKSWPFLLVLVAVLVAIGYIRARSRHDKKAGG